MERTFLWSRAIRNGHQLIEAGIRGLEKTIIEDESPEIIYETFERGPASELGATIPEYYDDALVMRGVGILCANSMFDTMYLVGTGHLRSRHASTREYWGEISALTGPAYEGTLAHLVRLRMCCGDEYDDFERQEAILDALEDCARDEDIRDEAYQTLAAITQEDARLNAMKSIAYYENT